eukprot:gene1126-10640_t
MKVDHSVSLSTIGYLSELKEVNTEKFLNSIVDKILNRKSEFIEYYENNDVNQINQIVEAFKVLFKKCLFFQNDEEVGKFINSLEISKEDKKLIFQIFKLRKEELQSYFKNSKISSSHLSDFDWKLQVILSSDKFSNIKEPILLLTLYIKTEDEEKELLIELSYDDLNHLLNNFSRINQKLNGTEIEFENVTGCLLCGKYLFHNLKIKKKDEMNLNIEKLGTVLTIDSIFNFLTKKELLKLSLLTIIGMDGDFKIKNEEKKKIVQIENIQIRKLDLNLLNEKYFKKEINLKLDHLIMDSFPFKKDTNILFNSSFKGLLDNQNSIELNSVPGISSNFEIKQYALKNLKNINFKYSKLCLFDGDFNLKLNSIILNENINLNLILNLNDLKIQSPKWINEDTKNLLRKLINKKDDKSKSSLSNQEIEFNLTLKKEEFSMETLKNNILIEIIKKISENLNQ